MPFHAQGMDQCHANAHLDEIGGRLAGWRLDDGGSLVEGARHRAVDEAACDGGARRHDDAQACKVCQPERSAARANLARIIGERERRLFEHAALDALGQVRKDPKAEIEVSLVECYQRFVGFVDAQAEGHARIAIQEVADLGCVVPGMVATDRHRDAPFRRTIGQRRQCLFRALEDAVDLEQEALASGCEDQLVGQTLEQFDPEIAFELADLGGDRRDRLLQPRGGEPQVAVLRHEVKGTQTTQVEAVELEHRGSL